MSGSQLAEIRALGALAAVGAPRLDPATLADLARIVGPVPRAQHQEVTEVSPTDSPVGATAA